MEDMPVVSEDARHMMPTRQRRGGKKCKSGSP